jgi:sugar lactone lactonase YvrE
MEWAQLPAGMTWDAATSSVAANGNGQVVVLVRTAPYFRMFNRDGSFVRSFGDDPDLFTLAHSVMFDQNGFIWATDSNGHAVHKFSDQGELLMTLGQKDVAGDNTSRDLFNRPNAIAVADNGDIYVSDGYINSRIVHFSPEGEFIRIIGGEIGDGPGQLTLPHGVVVDSNGRVIVGDSDNERISVFDADGNFVETWAVPSRGGMVIDGDDNVYVTDVNSNAVYVVSPDGETLEVIGGLGRAHGLTRDSDGALYASDAANRATMKITRR